VRRGSRTRCGSTDATGDGVQRHFHVTDTSRSSAHSVTRYVWLCRSPTVLVCLVGPRNHCGIFLLESALAYFVSPCGIFRIVQNTNTCTVLVSVLLDIRVSIWSGGFQRCPLQVFGQLATICSALHTESQSVKKPR